MQTHPRSGASLRCWFCKHGHTNRCSVSLAFGTPQIDGAQAEYVRVPEADGTLLHTPADIPDELLVMMSDIFPTGYYGAMRAIQNFGPPSTAAGTSEQAADQFTANLQPIDTAVFVCLGCGIVGLSAAATAVAKGVKTVFCVDSVEDRLEQARRLGGIPLRLGVDDIKGAVMNATDGRGADAVVESVGNKPALQSAYEMLRPCGYISSVGYHQTELPFTGRDGYQRNITYVSMLRCRAWARNATHLHGLWRLTAKQHQHGPCACTYGDQGRHGDIHESQVRIRRSSVTSAAAG